MKEYVDWKLLIPIAYARVKVRVLKAMWSFYRVGYPMLASPRHSENIARANSNVRLTGPFPARFAGFRTRAVASLRHPRRFEALHTAGCRVRRAIAALGHTSVRSAGDRQKARWRPSVCGWYLCGGYKYARKEKKKRKQCRETVTDDRAIGDDRVWYAPSRPRRSSTSPHAPRLTCRWTRPPSPCSSSRSPCSRAGGAKPLSAVFFRRVFVAVQADAPADGAHLRNASDRPRSLRQVDRSAAQRAAYNEERGGAVKRKKRNDRRRRHGGVLLSWGFPREKVIAVAILPWRMCVAELCQTGRSPRVFSSPLSRTSSFTSPSTFPSPSSTSRRECRRRRSRCAVALPWRIIPFGHLAKSAAIAAATTTAGTTSPAVPREDILLLERWGKEVPEAAASPEA